MKANITEYSDDNDSKIKVSLKEKLEQAIK